MHRISSGWALRVRGLLPIRPSCQAMPVACNGLRTKPDSGLWWTGRLDTWCPSARCPRSVPRSGQESPIWLSPCSYEGTVLSRERLVEYSVDAKLPPRQYTAILQSCTRSLELSSRRSLLSRFQKTVCWVREERGAWMSNLSPWPHMQSLAG